ncbi:uncharacterized protein LOC144506204 [Mustelus asterias]
MREIILYILMTFCGTVWNVQPWLTQTAKIPTEEENCTETNGQQPAREALQNVSIFSMDSGNCVNHFPISVFQIGSEETEQELSSEYQVECKVESHCQGLKLCCTNGTFLQSAPFQDEVGIDYYLGRAKLKVNVSEMATNHSGWDYLDLLRNASTWLTSALRTHNISDANVHVLCPEPPPGDQQYPVLDFMLVVNQNYSPEWLGQGFHNLTSTSEYLNDVELGDHFLQTGYTLTAQGQSVEWCENSTAPARKPNETDSTDSMWVKSSTTNSPSVAWPVNQSGQTSPTTTIVPNQPTVWAATVTGKAAAVTMETAFTAFRASVLVTNWNSTTVGLNDKSCIAYGKLEELFRSQFPQLLTEAAEVAFNRTLDVTMLVEGFGKGSVIVNIILLTPSGENMTLAAMNSLLTSAINQSLGSESGIRMSYGNIKDFDSCENKTCTYTCKALSEMLQCTCLNGLNGIWLACAPNKTISSGGVQAHIESPLVRELEKMTQFLDFANGTGCSFSKDGILGVRDLCQNITDNITDLWLEWKNEVLSLYLEGPDITVCQFSMTPEQEMMYKIIYSTGGVKGSFLVDYARMEDDQSVAFAKNETLNVTMIQQRRTFTLHENENLNVTVSIQSGLARNPQLFIKSCRAESSSHEPVGNLLIENGCPKSDGVSIFHNGNSSLVVLSIKASVAKNATYLKCELQICAEDQCACTINLGKIYMGNSDTSKETSIEIGPIYVLKITKTKDKEPSILMVILISVGTILLVILLIGFLRYMYRCFSGSSFSTKPQNFFRRRSAVIPVTLKSWKQV